MPGKLGRTTEQRMAILRNQASCLLWYGKIETTKARAKELQFLCRKNHYGSDQHVRRYDRKHAKSLPKRRAKKKREVTVTVVKDGPKKLAARRRIMAQAVRLAGDQGL